LFEKHRILELRWKDDNQLNRLKELLPRGLSYMLIMTQAGLTFLSDPIRFYLMTSQPGKYVNIWWLSCKARRYRVGFAHEKLFYWTGS